MSEIEKLPADIDTLHALMVAACAERDAAIAERETAIGERDRALSQIDRLRHLLRQLQRAHFGKRSEKLDPDQLLLTLEDIEQAIAESEAHDDKKDAIAAKVRAEKRRANRGALPRHLPRVDVTIAPEDTNCPCCRTPMHVIGEETSERLDVIPAQFRVIVTHRPKYACRACEEAPVQAPAPERLIKGGLPTEAMVAYVLAAKYAWHLPLYRQAQILLSQGVAIERATLAFWVGYAAAELKPLYLRLRELILGSLKIAVDETVAPVLDPGRGRTKKGYFWAIARDDRPWGGTDPPAIAYTYAPGRGAVHALKLLDTYHGIVQCDGYAAYKNIANAAYLGEAITLAFCWAHLRRKFFEIAKGGSAPIASEALDLPLERSDDLVACEVVGTDLVRCVGHDLLADQDAGVDELANLMMADTELCSRVAQCQPLAVLIGGAEPWIPCTRRRSPTRFAVQVLPWPVGIPIRFSDAAMS